MARFLLKLLSLETFLYIQFIGYSSSVPCDQNSWILLPSTTISQLTSGVSALNVTDCQNRCLLNSNCTGVAWNTAASICYFNFYSSSSAINYTAATTTNYYGLIRNYSTCDRNNYNCTLNWIGSKDIHGFQGLRIDRNTLIDCIRSCQDNVSCAAVDWNYQDNTCWIYQGIPSSQLNQTGIFQFIRNCTNGMPSTAGPVYTPRLSTFGPNTTTTTSISTSTTTSSTTINPTSSSTVGLTTVTSTSTSTTSTMSSFAPPSPVSTTTAPVRNDSVLALELKMEESDRWYPLAIKPAYIVLAGVGGGCILMVITAVVILCEYPLNKGSYAANGTGASRVSTNRSQSNYVESREHSGDIDMNEVEMEIDKKPYGNAGEFE